MFKNQNNVIKNSKKIMLGTAGLLSAAAIQLGLQNNEVHASNVDGGDTTTSTTPTTTSNDQHGVSLADNATTPAATAVDATKTADTSKDASSAIDKIVDDLKKESDKNTTDTSKSDKTTTTETEAKSKIVVKDSTLIAGPKTTWKAEDNFTSAVDENGKAVDFKDVTVDDADTVDLKKLGTYSVTYSFKDTKGNVIKQIAKITLVASKASVTVTDKTINQGTKWTAEDGFDSGTDAAGKPLKFSDITVAGSVDTSKIGTYKVTYAYVDSQGNKVPGAVSTVKVVSPDVVDKTSITVKNNIVSQGSNWSAADNFVGATDAQGNPLSLDSLKVTGNVDTNKPGQYNVIYSGIDSKGKTVSKTATITVLANNNPVTTGNNDTNSQGNVRGRSLSNLNNNSGNTGSAATNGSASHVNGAQLPKTGKTDSSTELAAGLVAAAGLVTLLGTTVKNKKRD